MILRSHIWENRRFSVRYSAVENRRRDTIFQTVAKARKDIAAKGFTRASIYV
jgi:hypothetical protein